MRKVLLLALFGILAGPALAVAPYHPAAAYREGEVIVEYREDADAPAARRLREARGLTALRPLLGGRAELLALPRFTTTREALAVLRADPAVLRAEPNFRRPRRAVVPNDTYFTSQWHLRNTGQAGGTPGADLNMINAWDANGDGTADRVGDPGVIVAVIDDAIDVDHPDLAPNIVGGRDLVCNDSDPSPGSADAGHGTYVAGVVAARGNNGAGVAGVGWLTGLLPIKFAFDEATHLAALEYARTHGARIINASFGGPGYSAIERDAIAALRDDDILYVAAAGNDDSNLDVARLSYPANYEADNIVAAAASNRFDNLTGFSQFGPLSVDVAAPGLQIVTTAMNGSYQTTGVSGTSFSSPATAGVAALVKAHVLPTPGWREIKARLIESGTAVGGNSRDRTIGGRVDADAALDMAPRPALVVTGVTFTGGDGDGALDANESVTAEFAVRNLWMDATSVSATLADDDADVSVDATPAALGDIAADGTATASIPVSVGAVANHRYVTFSLTLTAGGGYSATRRYIAEIGDLDPPESLTQSFSGGSYDEFHAWHVDVPAGASNKTLVIRTSTPSADVDLLARHASPPPYDITVGINPELEFGYFCTGGEGDCEDPATLVSGRLDGNEAITVVNPAAGAWHLVTVNFDQAATDYGLSVTLADGDLRPDPFDLVDQSNVTSGTATSNEITVSGLTAATFVTVAGGTYSKNGGAYTSSEGTVVNGDRLRVRVSTGGGFGIGQLTVGGVTETFFVNLPPPPTQNDTDTCGGGGVGVGGGGGGGGGGVPSPPLLALLLAAGLRRRLRS